MEKIFKIISKTLSTVLITVVVLLAILLSGIRLIGLTPYTVLSGSMEPTYHVGSVIYVKDISPDELKSGDPITYRISSDTIVTHRIVKVINEGTSQLSFQTKGDANKTEDGEIPASAIIGKPVFSTPNLENISQYVQNPLGAICLVVCAIVFLALSYVIDIIFSKQKKTVSKTDKDENIG